MKYNSRIKNSQLDAAQFISAITSLTPPYELHTFPRVLETVDPNTGEKVLETMQYACMRLSYAEIQQCYLTADSFCKSKDITDPVMKLDRRHMELIHKSSRMPNSPSTFLFANVDQLTTSLEPEEISMMLSNYETSRVNLGGSIDYMSLDERKEFVNRMAEESVLDYTSFLGLISASTMMDLLKMSGQTLEKLKSGIKSMLKSSEPLTIAEIEKLLKLFPTIQEESLTEEKH